MRVEVMELYGAAVPETYTGVEAFGFEETADDPGPRLVLRFEDGDEKRLNGETHDVVSAESEWC